MNIIDTAPLGKVFRTYKDGHYKDSDTEGLRIFLDRFDAERYPLGTDLGWGIISVICTREAWIVIRASHPLTDRV